VGEDYGAFLVVVDGEFGPSDFRERHPGLRLPGER
jgi:hypothetical protein